jgi:hypothetical protein
MKKKLFALLLAVGMAVSLCACGDSGNSGAAPVYDESPTAPDNSWAAEEPNETTEPDSEPMPPESTTDAQIPDSTPIITEPNKPEGLIIMTTTSSGFAAGTTDIIISNINPATGTATTISQFTFGNVRSDDTPLIGYITPEGSGITMGGGYYATRREWFDDDYDRMAITLSNSASAELHAGWINTDGEFFDVTTALDLEAKSDFDVPTKHNAIGFSEDGYFVYKSLAGDGPNARWEFYHVPLDNLSINAVEEGIWLPGAGETFQSKTSDLRFSDWDANSGQFLLNANKKISYLCAGVDDVGETYVPGESRLSWNGVFSPDGTSVAFMSQPKTGGVVNIYTMPLAGGDPAKVATDGFDLAMQEDCAKGCYTSGAACSMLIGWE